MFMPLKIRNPFSYRMEKMGINAKDTNLVLIINTLLILRQTDLTKFGKDGKRLLSLNTVFHE